ncbi:MAG: hypothetical protein ACK4M9_07080 [Anaerobacillus sp.]|uniref:hypothetical protein n=1 Tax=Anaerobacillus sp. TaxID=1872506 RepID=UPI00391CA5DB
MKKMIFIFTCLLCSFLVACNGSNKEIAEQKNALITFQNVTITEMDALNAQVTPEESLQDAARDLLFQEIMIVEAEKAGITYDEFSLDGLVNQTHAIFEYDQEAITFITAKSELYNLTPEDYIDTIWKEGLKKKLIANNYLMEHIDFNEKETAEIEAEVEEIRNELLAKYKDEIEYHF